MEEVRVRTFEPDKKGIVSLLKKHKTLSNQKIAEKLNIPQTKVEHWFRTDGCFAVPDSESWFRLKALLGIESTEYDEQITSFETKDSSYERTGRVYGCKGISPTIMTTTDIKVIRPYGTKTDKHSRKDNTYKQ